LATKHGRKHNIVIIEHHANNYERTKIMNTREKLRKKTKELKILMNKSFKSSNIIIIFENTKVIMCKNVRTLMESLRNDPS